MVLDVEVLSLNAVRKLDDVRTETWFCDKGLNVPLHVEICRLVDQARWSGR